MIYIALCLYTFAIVHIPSNFDAKRVTPYNCIYREQNSLGSRRLPTCIIATGYVFSLRERAILLFLLSFSLTLSLSLSLSFFSSLWRMLFNAATTVRHVSENEGENGAGRRKGGPWRGRVDRVIAGAGWHRLMGFEDSGVTPRDLTARLPRIMNPPPPLLVLVDTKRRETDLSLPFLASRVGRWFSNRSVGKKGHG